MKSDRWKWQQPCEYIARQSRRMLQSKIQNRRKEGKDVQQGRYTGIDVFAVDLNIAFLKGMVLVFTTAIEIVTLALSTFGIFAKVKRREILVSR